MVPREALAVLDRLAKGFPVLLITGPRQSGKTTLSRAGFPDKEYVSLEDPDNRAFASEDPRGFLARYDDGAIFDEVQRCPEILSYIQNTVDENPKPGRFVLTGSQQFGLLAGITQSLAGRVGSLKLLPFSYTECYGSSHAEALDHVLWTGFYPPIHDRSITPPDWLGNYVETYVERDVRQMINVIDLGTFQRFLRLCAGRSGQLLNLSDLSSDAGITHNTAKAWISVLEASFIVFLLRPHHENFSKRLIKTTKLYFYDTGLLCWLLSIREPDQLGVHAMRGAIFETFIVSELVKNRYNDGLPLDLYFWRDRSGNEIDVLIDRGEKLQALEVKSGMTLNTDYFKGLKKWAVMAGDRAVDPLLVYGGRENRTQHGVTVRSWTRIAEL